MPRYTVMQAQKDELPDAAVQRGAHRLDQTVDANVGGAVAIELWAEGQLDELRAPRRPT